MNPPMPGHFAPVGAPPRVLNLPPFPPPSSAFWNTGNVQDHLKDFNDSLNLAKAMVKELELLIKWKNIKESDKNDDSLTKLSEFIEKNKIDVVSLEKHVLEAANALTSKLRVQIEPFRLVVDENTPWEEKSAVMLLADKEKKYKRNKVWRKRKRKAIAKKFTKARDRFEQIDKEADEWRAREISKDIAKQKVEKLKVIAKLKGKEEQKRLESELELILMVEKLQELRSIRIQKLKKQGHFLPEEDDKFLDKVRVAVEEEERQMMVATDSEAAKDAIATAEESRRTIEPNLEEKPTCSKVIEDQIMDDDDAARGSTSTAVIDKESRKDVNDSVVNLPAEFYHYYYGSNTDTGTLIEVRRTWDAYIRPGGSRIPSHWVQPPPPSDAVWASYLAKP